MPLFRHPLRPLTHVGRTLLCAAAATGAALLLMLSPPAQAADTAAPRAATRVDVQIDGDMDEVTVVLPAAADPRSALLLTVRAPRAVRELRSPTHDIDVAGTGTREASVTLADSRANGAARADNRELRLQVRLADARFDADAATP